MHGFFLRKCRRSRRASQYNGNWWKGSMIGPLSSRSLERSLRCRSIGSSERVILPVVVGQFSICLKSDNGSGQPSGTCW